MIDRAALETVVANQSEAMGNNLTFELHLYNAEVYCVGEISEYFDNYFVALVYPKEPLSIEKVEQIPKNKDGKRILDCVIIPYQAVSYVLLTAREPEKYGKLGFHNS